MNKQRLMGSTALLCLSLGLSFMLSGQMVEAAVQVSGPQGSGWTMIFNDEFDGSKLDTSKWNTCFHWATDYNFNYCRAGNDELQWYQPDDVSVQNGLLQLKAEKRSLYGANYTSGMVASNNKFNYLYGYAEARFRVPKGKGFWPAFWTLPKDNTWPPEIDIMEILGDKPTVAYTTLHWGADNSSSGKAYNGPDFSADFHTFAADWEPGLVMWYIDGVEVFRMTTNVPTKDMYLILNLAVGGAWPGSPNASTVFPSTFDVDYVRVWQKQNAAPITTATNVVPTATVMPPTFTATSVPPSETPVPPTFTATVIPPTATATNMPPSETAIPPTFTETSLPPSETPIVPTASATDIPPSETALPPTFTATMTEISPTATNIPPSETPLPATPTLTPTPNGPTLTIVVSPVSAANGATVKAALKLNNMSNLYGLQVECQVDSTVLSGAGHTEGDIFTNNNSFMVDSGAQADGKWSVAASLLNPAPAFNGDGVAFNLNYKVVNAGHATIECTILAVDTSGILLPVAVVNGSFDGTQQPVVTEEPSSIPPSSTPELPTVTFTPTFTPTLAPSLTPIPGAINGVVQYEKHNDPTGITVKVLSGGAPFADGTINADGSFQLNDVPAGSYVVQFSAPGYLSTTAAVDVQAGQGATVQVTLIAGDIDGSGAIDLADATFIGANYGIQSPPAPEQADLNGDGTINLLDLVLVGKNFGKTSG